MALKQDFLHFTFCVLHFPQEETTINALVEKGNNFPYIIAFGESQENITRYFIEIEKHLIDVGLK